MDSFKGIVVREKDDEIISQLEDLGINQLSDGDLLVKVEYSTVNYKDMLAFQKDGGVIRKYPMIPGIDLAGKVVSSQNSEFKEGDRILVNSTDIGVTKTGGYAEYARISSEDAIHTPKKLSSKEAMTFGTAGFTAALSIDALMKHGMSAENNPSILVTGATGGVGSTALSILAKLGYKNIHALVRKDYQVEVAERLSANHILYAEELQESTSVLASRKYNYVLDTVGGDVAAHALAQIYEDGSMSMCGNAGDNQFNTTVLPMILRGVNILGINSVHFPKKEKENIWDNLANEWNVVDELVVKEINLEDVNDTVDVLKEGKHLGRTVVKIN